MGTSSHFSHGVWWAEEEIQRLQLSLCKGFSSGVVTCFLTRILFKMILSFKDWICGNYSHQVKGFIYLKPLNEAKFGIQKAGGNASCVCFLFLLRSAWESKEAIFSLILVISKCWSMTLWCSRHWTFKAPALNKGGLADANENIHLIPLAISKLHEKLFSSYSFKSLNTGIW